MYIEYSLRGLLNLLFRHQIKIVAIGAVTVLLGLIYIFSLEKTYQSNATLLVKFGEGATLDLNRDRPTEVSRNDRKETLQSYVTMIKSRDLLMDAVKTFGVEKLFPTSSEEEDEQIAEAENIDTDVSLELRQAASKIAGRIEVTADRDSNILNISVTHDDPEIAARFTEVLVQTFIEHQNDIFSPSETNFLAKQIQEAQEELSKAQKEFQNFKKSVSISDLNREMDVLLSEKSSLSTIAFSAVSNAQAELAALKAKEAEMRVTYQEDSPLLQSVRDQIEATEQVLEERQGDLASAQQEGGTLAPRLEKIDERIAYLEEHRPEYERYAQNVKAKEKDYTYLKEKGEDARINEMLRQQNITRISVLEKPLVPTAPVSHPKKLLLIAFLMLGGLLGLSAALVFEILDDHITSAEEIEHTLDLPVLASFDEPSQGGRAAT